MRKHMNQTNILKWLPRVQVGMFTILATLGLMVSPGNAQNKAEAGFPMVDPALDDPAKPWCYFTHPVSVIGMPWQPDAIGIQVAAWKAEYARRFADHVKAGGPVKKYSPLTMQTPEERLRDGVVSLKIDNLATGKKVTSSKSQQAPEFANDGKIDNAHFWESNEKDAWWQVDLGEAKEISTLIVVPLHKDNRSYKFLVKTSVDGKNWTLHIDKRDNKEAFGPQGCEEQFQNTPMRYIRVEMFGNSLNTGNHLVELIAK